MMPKITEQHLDTILGIIYAQKFGGEEYRKKNGSYIVVVTIKEGFLMRNSFS